MNNKEYIYENERLLKYGISWCEEGKDSDDKITTLCINCKYCEECEIISDMCLYNENKIL